MRIQSNFQYTIVPDWKVLFERGKDEMLIFQVNVTIIHIIAFIIYTSIFIGTLLIFVLLRNRLNAIKIMLFGIGLLLISSILISIPDLQVNFTILNYLVLLLGVIVLYIGLLNRK